MNNYDIPRSFNGKFSILFFKTIIILDIYTIGYELQYFYFLIRELYTRFKIAKPYSRCII